MKIVILGGDGFIGWPTALHLSKAGHEVFIVDNLSHRNIDNELGTNSLTPISTINERLRTWKEISGQEIAFYNFDVAEDYEQLLSVLLEFRPDTLIHFAQQSSAPYSMSSSKHKRYTVRNNTNGTNTVLATIVESGLDIHLVHMGTMGVYGYGTSGMKIPEGYLPIKVETDEGDLIDQEILYPTNPGSVYHMTKSLDQILFAYYAKNDNLRITDLHQGIVWGTQTKETVLDERLINRFNYDEAYGTVLNRFLVEAALDYPLTVYGIGGQTRAFINIQNSVECVELAVKNPPKKGDRVKIFNQMTEIHSVRELAEIVSGITGVKIDHVPDPRKEDAENELYVKNEQFLALGLKPILLNDGLLSEVTEIAKKYASRAKLDKIAAKSLWNQGVPAAKI